MLGPNDDAAARCLAWARHELGADPDDSLRSVRKTFWLRVERDGMLPSRATVAAMDQLRLTETGDTHDELPHEFLLAEELRLAEEVEAFARHMFDMPISARQSRWHELHKQCQLARRPRARLSSLSPGLNIDRSRIDPKDQDAASLASELCALLTAPFAERATCIRRLRDLWKDDDQRRYAAARRFARQFPRFATLVPEMMDELLEHPKTRQEKENFQEDPLKCLTGTKTRQGSQQTERGLSLPFYYLLAVCVIAMIILITLNHDSDKRRDHRSRQRQESERIWRQQQEEMRRQLDRQNKENLWRDWKTDTRPAHDEVLKYLKNTHPELVPLLSEPRSKAESPRRSSN